MRAERLPTIVFPVTGASRANVIVTGPPRGQLRFNPPGPEITGAEWRGLKAVVGQSARSSSLLICSGSLPRGVPLKAYAELIRIARGAGRDVLLDCEGAALEAAIPERPFLVKPNHHELGTWAGHSLRTRAELMAAARELSRATRGWVLVSAGSEGGLLVHDRENIAWMAPAPKLPGHKFLNAVGAGDALLAGVARQISAGASPEDWLRWGLAAGTAATTKRPAASHRRPW